MEGGAPKRIIKPTIEELVKSEVQPEVKPENNEGVLKDSISRPDLLANSYILEGNDEKALDLILEYKDINLHEVMVETLSLLLEKNPEKRDKIMEEVSIKNPELIKYMNERGEVFLEK